LPPNPRKAYNIPGFVVSPLKAFPPPLHHNLKSKKMNKTILITGASSGIGAATAKTISKQRLECYRHLVDTRKRSELITLSNALVTKLDVLDVSFI
jgi:hypothetical protein